MKAFEKKIKENPEPIFIGLILASLILINFLIKPNAAFLDFYFLPIIAVGYLMGKRKAVLFAFFTILCVGLLVLFDKEAFAAISTGVAGHLNFAVWGGFLILAGWLGSLSEKLQQELLLSNELREKLALEKELLKASNDRLAEYTNGLEERVSSRTKDLEKAHRELELSANTDPLTRLLNRRGMADKLDNEKFRFERNKKPFSIVLCDIDHFKRINDNYGHDAGDYILREVANLLNAVSRKPDTFCRWGGEEFLALLPETDLKGGAILAEKLRTTIEEQQFVFNNNSIPVTLSFGLSEFDETMTIDTCIKMADRCLYLAKEAGRNQLIPKLSNL